MIGIPVFVGLLFFSPIFQAGQAQPAGPDENNRMSKNHAPTPFSAAEIRDACPTGRRTKYKIEAPGRPDSFRITTFANSTLLGTTFESVTLNSAGKQVGETQKAEIRWVELQAHASFPKTQTKITSEKYTTPAGTYACRLYTVTSVKEGKKVVQRYRFAKMLPGPPLCFEQEVEGKLSFRMTLIKSERVKIKKPGGKNKKDKQDKNTTTANETGGGK